MKLMHKLGVSDVKVLAPFLMSVEPEHDAGGAPQQDPDGFMMARDRDDELAMVCCRYVCFV